jgi:hypothetical protein
MDQIELSKLETSAGTQMRLQIDERVIEEYAEHLSELPPIVVFRDGERYIVADGFQRLAAFSKRGEKQIPCEIKVGTVRDAILYAAGANATHGVRRNNGDKRRAIETLLRDQEWRRKSDRWIADVVKVGAPLVGSVRSEMFTTTQVKEITPDKPPGPRVVQGRDGKTYTVPQRSSKPTVSIVEEPVAAPRIEPRQQPQRRDMQWVRDRVAQIVEQLIHIRDDIVAGLIDGTEDELADAVSSIELAIRHGQQIVRQAGGAS